MRYRCPVWSDTMLKKIPATTPSPAARPSMPSRNWIAFDGMDGLAAGLGVVAGIFFSIVSLRQAIHAVEELDRVRDRQEPEHGEDHVEPENAGDPARQGVEDHTVGDRRRRRGDLSEQFQPRDRKSTRLNSSHGYISYAVFCLK